MRRVFVRWRIAACFFGPLMILCVVGSSESFAQWVIQNSGTTARLNDVAALDSVTAIAVGNNGTVLKTTNAGTTWVPKPIATSANLNSTAFFRFSAGDGYAVGNGVICYSSDEGETWQVDAAAQNFVVVEYGAIINPDVYMGSATGLIRYRDSPSGPWRERTLQGGSVLSIGLRYGGLQSTYPLIATHGFTYSLSDSVSNPTGVWDLLAGGDLRNTVQYLLGSGGNPGPIPFLLRRGGTFGNAWQRVQGPPPPLFAYDLKASRSGELVYLCGSRRAIYRSSNYGDTWTIQFGNIGFHFPALRALSFLNENLGYAVGDSGLIAFTRNGGVTSSGSNDVLPAAFALYQNYPNPFNPTTEIRYQTSEVSRVTLDVFDMLGRKVATLVDEVQGSGFKSVKFDAGGLASGVYFYRLNAGGFVETKKLMVIR